MYELKFENSRGEILPLTGVEGRYQVIEVDGLSPPNANISISELPNMAGGKFLNAKVQTRNLVLTVKPMGNVEKNRQDLYRFFNTGQFVKMYYRNGALDVYIEGYVDGNECSLFTNNEVMQVSITCPDPYFKALDAIVTSISSEIALFTFPFAFGAGGLVEGTATDDAIEFSVYNQNNFLTIENPGADETGLVISLNAIGEVSNPVIFNANTRESFALMMDMTQGDNITINTNRGEKSVTLTRGGVTTNIVGKVKMGSTWLALDSGDNLFTYDADIGLSSLRVEMSYRMKYLGV